MKVWAGLGRSERSVGKPFYARPRASAAGFPREAVLPVTSHHRPSITAVLSVRTPVFLGRGPSYCQHPVQPLLTWLCVSPSYFQKGHVTH